MYRDQGQECAKSWPSLFRNSGRIYISAAILSHDEACVMIASGAQIRAGRALLGWRQADLAKAAGLHTRAVAYWEAKVAVRKLREEAGVARIRRAFEAAGVVTFVDPSPGGRFVARG